ncbi:hypothetical protein Hanom_Chr14g01328871 [Helianthus anomalus]
MTSMALEQFYARLPVHHKQQILKCSMKVKITKASETQFYVNPSQTKILKMPSKNK